MASRTMPRTQTMTRMTPRAAVLASLSPPCRTRMRAMHSPDTAKIRAAVDSASPPRKGRAHPGQCEQEQQPHRNLRQGNVEKPIQAPAETALGLFPVHFRITLAPPDAPGHRQAAHSQRSQ